MRDRRSAFWGWRWQGEFPTCSKLVMIVAPHTSNWDLPMAMLFKWALGVKVSYLAKHTLFWWPLGWFLRSTGAIPVRRDRHHDVVNQVAQQFEQSSRLWLAIAPAGTRSKTDHWRSGFYHIVQAAGVPLVPVRLDLDPKSWCWGAASRHGSSSQATWITCALFRQGARAETSAYLACSALE